VFSIASMGSSVSTHNIISFREAESRCSDQELERFRKGFYRLSRPVPKSSSLLTTLSAAKGSKGSKGSSSLSNRKIDKSAFISEVLGSSLPSQIAERMFSAFDTGKNGYLLYRDFIIALAIMTHGSPEEKSLLVFEIYDVERTGYVELKDMMAIFSEDMLIKNHKESKEEILHRCFDLADRDGDGKLSYDELRAWAQDNKDLTSLTKWIFEEKAQEEFDLRGSLRISSALSHSIHFDDKELKDLERIYADIKSKSPNGHVDKDTLISVFPPGMPSFLLDRIFVTFDDNLDGFIDSKEFLCGLSPFCKGKEDEKLSFWFKIFDADRDGKLSEAELLAMISSLWKVAALKSDFDEDYVFAAVEADNADNAEGASSLRASQHMDEAEEEFLVKTKNLVQQILLQFDIEDGKLSLEQFKTWVSTSELARQFLEMITRMSSICFGLRPQSPAEEKDIIDELMANEPPLAAGDSVYVVSARWWALWKEWAATGDQEKSRVSAPPPIDNGPIVVKKKKKGKEPAGVKTTATSWNRLKPNLVKDDDFIIVNSQVWNVIFNWYGGGPILARKVVETYKGLAPELDPLILLIAIQKTPTESTRPVSHVYSKYTTLQQMTKSLCDRWNISDTGKIHIWNYFYESRPVMLTEMSKTLDECDIVNDQKIIVERQAPDGSWPLDSIPSTPADVKVQAGVVGLNNIGNTCFMNSAIQCLSNTPPLVGYFTSETYLYELNAKNPLGHNAEVAKAYGDLMKSMWVGDSKGKMYPAVAPRQLKRTISKFAPDFAGNQQHDSSELLAFLMDGLHEGLNRVVEKPLVPDVEGDNMSDEELAVKSWEAYCKRNQSIVVDLFQGQLKSTVTCPDCNKTSIKFDPFSMLSIPLTPDKNRALEVCVHWADPDRTPMVFGVFVSTSGKVSDLKNALSPLCGLSPKQLKVIQIQGHYVFRNLINGTPLKMFRSRELIHAYEVSNGMVVHKIPYSKLEQELKESGDGATGEDDKADTGTASSEGSSMGRKKRSKSKKKSKDGGEEGGSGEGKKDKGKEKQESEDDGSSEKKRKAAKSKKAVRRLLELDIATIVVVHRFLVQVEDYFLNPYKTNLFGVPILLSLSKEERTYDAVFGKIWTQLGRVLKIPEGVKVGMKIEDSMDEAKARDAFLDELRNDPPFRLKLVNKNGTACHRCAWYRYCKGCEFLPDSDPVEEWQTIAIDWETKTLRSYYDTDRAERKETHSSVKDAYEQENLPISLKDCLDLFTAEEKLGVDEVWHCGNCDDFRRAKKKIDLWKLPPFLVLHFKRFRYNGYHYQKLGKLITFPIMDVDFSPYVVRPGAIPKYDLYAAVNHYGSLGRGHYVAHARNQEDMKWRKFDDSRCQEVDPHDLVDPSAYLLFFAAKDLVPEELMPAIAEGAVKQDPRISEGSPFCKVM